MNQKPVVSFTTDAAEPHSNTRMSWLHDMVYMIMLQIEVQY